MATSASTLHVKYDKRRDPFTGADQATSKNEVITIPSSSPYYAQLTEIPRQDNPLSVTISGFTEVQTTPGAWDFQVDYTYNTGKIRFNSARAGATYSVTYYGTGSVCQAKDINSVQGLTVGNALTGTLPNPGWNWDEILSDSYLFHDDFDSAEGDTAGALRYVHGRNAWIAKGNLVSGGQTTDGAWAVRSSDSTNRGCLFLADGSASAALSAVSLPVSAARFPTFRARARKAGTGAVTAWIGLGNNSGSAPYQTAPSDGIYLEIALNTGATNFVTRASSSQTATATGNRFSQMTTFEIEISPSLVTLTVDGSCYTHAANIPTARLTPWAQCDSTTSGEGIDIDEIHIRQARG